MPKMNRAQETQILQRMIGELNEKIRLADVAKREAINRLVEINTTDALFDHYGFERGEWLPMTPEAVEVIIAQKPSAKKNALTDRKGGVKINSLCVDYGRGEIIAVVIGVTSRAHYRIHIELACSMFNSQFQRVINGGSHVMSGN